MNRAAAQTWVRSAHLVAAFVAGVPTALLGSYGAVFVLAGGVMSLLDGELGGMVFLSWGLAAVLGTIAWTRLTLAYALNGRDGLFSCDNLWWFALLAGVVAAVIFLFAFRHSLTMEWWDWQWLLFGPMLIPLALHLLWLRFQPSRSSMATSS